MFKKLLLGALLSLPLATTACDGGGMTVPDSALKPGGVFVAYTLGCKQGCDKINRFDLIQEVDGTAVATRAELEAANLTDGQPHKLKVYQASTKEVIEVELVAEPNQSMPPIKDAPPFWTAGAEELKATPSWARRRLFGHAMPQIRLMNVDGGQINGRDFYGKKHIVAIFDWAATSERLHGATYLQVLQKAQADLKRAGVDVVFAQMQFVSERTRPPMNDTDLRKFFNDNQVSKKEGGPLPPPPMYREPNTTEENTAQELGLEGSFTVKEAWGEPPVILIVDEGGMVRWHSAGVQEDMDGTGLKPEVYTINKAVLFALENLK